MPPNVGTCLWHVSNDALSINALAAGAPLPSSLMGKACRRYAFLKSTGGAVSLQRTRIRGTDTKESGRSTGGAVFLQPRCVARGPTLTTFLVASRGAGAPTKRVSTGPGLTPVEATVSECPEGINLCNPERVPLGGQRTSLNPAPEGLYIIAEGIRGATSGGCR